MSNVAVEVHYAGFWRRFAALFLDGMLFTALTLPIMVLIYDSGYLNWWLGSSSDMATYGLFDLLVTYLLPFALLVFCWRRWQATPGKMLMDCRVVDARTLQPLSLRQAVIRALGYILSALPLYLGFVWAAFDKRKQALHDKLAGSLVIRVNDDEGLISAQQWQERFEI